MGWRPTQAILVKAIIDLEQTATTKELAEITGLSVSDVHSSASLLNRRGIFFKKTEVFRGEFRSPPKITTWTLNLEKQNKIDELLEKL